MTTVDYTNAPLWLQWIMTVGVVVASIGAVFGLIRAIPPVWTIVSRFVTRINSLDYLDDLPQFMITTAATLADQDTKIDEIHHQTHDNNGSSIKDSNKRIETRLARVEEGVKGIYGRLDSADKDRAELREDLEQTKPRPPARKRPAKPNKEQS